MSRYEELWRIAWTLIALIFLLVVIFSTAQANHVIIYSSKESNLGELMLVAATLVLTCVAVALAIGALWGYRELKEAAINSAVAAAEKEARITARSVAQTVVARTTFSPPPLEDGTSAKEAEDIVEAQKQELESQT